MYGTEADEERSELWARLDAIEGRLDRLEAWAQGETDLMEDAVGHLVLVARAVRELRRQVGRRA